MTNREITLLQAFLAEAFKNPAARQAALDAMRDAVYAMAMSGATPQPALQSEAKPEFAQFVDTPQKRFLYNWGRRDGYQDGYSAALAATPQPAPAAVSERGNLDAAYAYAVNAKDGHTFTIVRHAFLAGAAWHAALTQPAQQQQERDAARLDWVMRVYNVPGGREAIDAALQDAKEGAA